MDLLDTLSHRQNENLHSLLADLINSLNQLPEAHRAVVLPRLMQLQEALLAEARQLALDDTSREASELLEAVFKADPGGLAVVTLKDMVYRMANAAYQATLPDPSIDPSGHTLSEIWPDENLTLARTVFANIADTNKSMNGGHQINYPDGSTRYFTTHLVPIAWRGQPAVLLVNWETTRLEEALRDVEKRENQLCQSEARYRQLLETAYEGIWTIDADGITDFINERGAQILGYKVEEMLGKPALSFHIPEDLDNARQNLEAKKRGISSTSEFRMQHKSGAVLWISSSTSPIVDEQGQFIGMLAMFTDITQHRHSEQVLRSLEVQRRLMEHRERERQEIARNIHDGPIQSLVGMLFSLKAAREVTQSPAYLNLLEQITGGIRESVQELRGVVNELRPPALLNYGLSRAIQIHTEDLRSRHPDLQIDLDLIEDEKLLPEDTCLALYRIYQEGMNNIFRHAQASQVWIRYYLANQHMNLQIRDNGQGFALPADWVEFTRNNHFGVAGMRERAEAVNGTLHITSQPDQGTTLEVRVPLP